MPITIRTTPALIGIQTTPGKLEMHTTKANLNMETTHPQLEITTEKPQIQIDQSQSFSEAGQKSISELVRENAALAKQNVLSTIAKTARQGRELANIQNKSNPIPSQAEENAFTQFDREFGFGTLPQSGPEISLIRGKVNINLKEGQVDTNPVKGEVNYTYIKSKVEIYLRQKNSIEISYIDERV